MCVSVHALCMHSYVSFLFFFFFNATATTEIYTLSLHDALPISHDRGDLRHAEVVSHDRVVVEDARRAVLPWEHAALVRQIHAGRVHEVHDRDALAHRDLLRAQHLLDRLRPPAARLHAGGVGQHHHRPTG